MNVKFKKALVVVGVLAAALAQAQHPISTSEARSLALTKYGGRVIASKNQGQYIDVTIQNGNTVRDVFFNRHTGRIDHERQFQKRQTHRRVTHVTRRAPLHVHNGDPFFKKTTSNQHHVFHKPIKHRDDHGKKDVVRQALDHGNHKDNGKHLGQLKNGNNGKHKGEKKDHDEPGHRH